MISRASDSHARSAVRLRIDSPSMISSSLSRPRIRLESACSRNQDCRVCGSGHPRIMRSADSGTTSEDEPLIHPRSFFDFTQSQVIGQSRILRPSGSSSGSSNLPGRAHFAQYLNIHFQIVRNSRRRERIRMQPICPHNANSRRTCKTLLPRRPTKRVRSRRHRRRRHQLQMRQASVLNHSPFRFLTAARPIKSSFFLQSMNRSKPVSPGV